MRSLDEVDHSIAVAARFNTLRDTRRGLGFDHSVDDTLEQDGPSVMRDRHYAGGMGIIQKALLCLDHLSVFVERLKSYLHQKNILNGIAAELTSRPGAEEVPAVLSVNGVTA